MKWYIKYPLLVLALTVSFGLGAYTVWANKPLDTPLWCVQKGTDALAVIVHNLPIEEVENWIMGIGIIAGLVALYGIWGEMRRIGVRQ